MVDAQLIEAFRRDGAVCVRGALSADEVVLVEQGIERNWPTPSDRGLVASRDNDPGGSSRTSATGADPSSSG